MVAPYSLFLSLLRQLFSPVISREKKIHTCTRTDNISNEINKKNEIINQYFLYVCVVTGRLYCYRHRRCCRHHRFLPMLLSLPQHCVCVSSAQNSIFEYKVWFKKLFRCSFFLFVRVQMVHFHTIFIFCVLNFFFSFWCCMVRPLCFILLVCSFRSLFSHSNCRQFFSAVVREYSIP